MVEAVLDCDANAVLKLYPEAIVENAMAAHDCDNRKELAKFAENYIRRKLDDLDTYTEMSARVHKAKNKGWKITYKVVEEVDILNSTFSFYKERYQNQYGINIDAAKEIELEMTEIMNHNKDNPFLYKLVIQTIKINGKWYVGFLDETQGKGQIIYLP